MRETIEFRISEADAATHLPHALGSKVGRSVRKVVVESDDPLVQRIVQLQRQFNERGKQFFWGWNIRRQYAQHELDSAELLAVFPVRTSTLADDGSAYDESTACPICGAGARQIDALSLNVQHVKGNIKYTLDGEWLLSQEAAESFISINGNGYQLRAIKPSSYVDVNTIDLTMTATGRQILNEAKKVGVPHPSWQFWVWLNRPLQRQLVEQARAEWANMSMQRVRFVDEAPSWYQLIVEAPNVDIVPPTKIGSGPRYEAGGCPAGDTLGVGLLSEMTVAVGKGGRGDFMASRQFIGLRRGYLRPARVVFVSQHARKKLELCKRDVRFEPVHVV